MAKEAGIFSPLYYNRAVAERRSLVDHGRASAMNWLAHLHLSEPNAAFRIGNLLPDFARIGVLETLPEDFQRGIRQHRRIDAFTDSHSVFRRSVTRLDPSLRRFGPIVVDLFYDHFLTCDWDVYARLPLLEFAREFYASIDEYREELNPESYERLCAMREGDWICSYHSPDGLRAALSRVGARMRRPIDLSAAVDSLEGDYEEFYSDFRTFFPELERHVMPVGGIQLEGP